MKAKQVILISLLVFALLFLSGQLVRSNGLLRDIFISQFVFAIVAYLLYWKGILKGRWKHLLLPLSILFWYIFDFFLENIFSNFHDWKFLTIGTPNIFLCAVGATYGTLLAAGKWQRVAGVLLLVLSGLFSWWFIAGGSNYWYNYVSDGTFTGKVREKTEDRWWSYVDAHGVLDEATYKDKTIVLDFWNVSCGVCFRKFPYLDSLTRKYSNNKNVVFIAVNLPLKEEDSLKYKKVKELNAKYSFETVFADTAAARRFQIDGVPKVLIMRKDSIVFRGNVELAGKYLQETIK